MCVGVRVCAVCMQYSAAACLNSCHSKSKQINRHVCVCVKLAHVRESVCATARISAKFAPFVTDKLRCCELCALARVRARVPARISANFALL